MPFYEATFGDETCYVLVESRPSERGAAFVATPYVLDTEILYWFPNGEGRAIEVPGASEGRTRSAAYRGDCLSRMAAG